MALKKDKNLKMYYSIREVSEIIGVNESTLRYWETELPQLKPKTLPSTRVRQYTDQDIELLKTIYNLVKVRGFRLSAARRMINQNPQAADRTADVIQTLISVRDQLKQLKNQLGAI